jgi:hypothetical protein
MSKKKKSFARMKDEVIRKLQAQAPEIIEQIGEETEVYGASHGAEFPLPMRDMWIYREDISSVSQNTFVVCAFFTPNEIRYYKFAQRLLTSCNEFSLPCCVYQIPEIHKSISLNGCDDLAFTKANFIAYNMARFPDKNVLYLDVDVLFVDYPERIADISGTGYDFAIYNWLSDRENAGYFPIFKEVGGKSIATEQYAPTLFYPYYCPDQLRCSGGVQFYRNCSSIKNFLKSWLNVIAQCPDAADDECLDYTYNNLDTTSIELHPVWLDKSYLRLPQWPHIKPVILHPGFAKDSKRIHVRNSFYPERCQKRAPIYPFPLGYVLDTRNKLLLRSDDSGVIDIQKIDQDLWIYPEDST